MHSDSTLIGRAAAAVAAAAAADERAARPPLAAAATVVDRSDTAARVAAVIARRARVAGLSDAAYFREIIAGRAPRITRSEAASEPLPTGAPPPPRVGAAAGDDAILH